MNDAQINAIVEQVVRKLSTELSTLPSSSSSGAPRASAAPAFHSKRPGVFDDLDSATSAAQAAHGQVRAGDDAAVPSPLAPLFAKLDEALKSFVEDDLVDGHDALDKAIDKDWFRAFLKEKGLLTEADEPPAPPAKK